MFSSFQNQFLIAMPDQVDGVFDHALVYICQHNDEGAMGLIVNKPLPVEIHALTRELGMETAAQENAKPYQNQVFFGGPCQSNHGFILHDGGLKWASSIVVNEELVLTSSKDILMDIAALKGPEHFLLTLGYAGWSAGQLESEMAHNTWLNVEACNDTLFNTDPEQRWLKAAQVLGVDLKLLSREAGFG